MELNINWKERNQLVNNKNDFLNRMNFNEVSDVQQMLYLSFKNINRNFRHIRDKKPKIRLNYRIRKLEEFKSYFIESIIESRSFVELKQYIIDRYGVD